MKLITAVLREDAVDDVQIALARQGISGMTVTEVTGYAHQRGHTEVYRGEEFTISFITKIRLDILAKDADAETIVQTICPEFSDSNDWAAVADPLLAPAIYIGERFGIMPEIYIADNQLSGALFTNDEVRIKARHFLSVFVADYRPLYKANAVNE